MNAIDLSTEEFFTSPELAGKLRFAVIDHTGDTKYIWDANNADEVAVARGTFESFTKPVSQGGKGYAAFRVTDRKGEKGEQVRSFDPAHERLIFAPPMVGG
jgi:hypothetical protein